MASISDRWHVTDSSTGGRRRSARFGTGKRWQVRYRDLDGSSRNRSFERKADAERFLVQLSSQLMAGSYIDPRAGRVPVGVYAEEWFARQTYGPTSREAVRHRLNAYVLPAWRDVPLVNVRPNDVQAWIRHLQGSLASSTVRQVFVTFSAVMGAASAEGLIGPNPTKAAVVRLPAMPTRRVHPWTADRVELVLEVIPDRYRLAAVVAAGCGLRQGECFGLRLEDVDFERREIHVRQQIVILNSRPTITAPKYGRTRSVPAPEWVLAAVRAHVAQWPPLENGLLTYGRERKPLNKNYFNTSIWRPALDAAGVPRGRANGMHVLRHTCASLWLEHGVSIKAVSEYLGHADPGFTLRVYTHVMPTSGERARNAMDEAFLGRRPEERRGQRGRTYGAREHDEHGTTTENNGQH